MLMAASLPPSGSFAPVFPSPQQHQRERQGWVQDGGESVEFFLVLNREYRG